MLRFISNQAAYNLLIIISDLKGETIFLDNKKNFQGTYEKTIDLSTAAMGPCTLCIISDEERLDYKVGRIP